jgi:multidrug efflux pump subunit AcrB
MKLTEASLRNPAAVAVGVALACAFGLLALAKLPLQLFPEIERPQMSIQTAWRAASPQEMESEIVEPIETVMQGLPGLEEIASNVSPGFSNINLTFAVGSDTEAMLVEVLSRMNRLPPLPRDATPPVVRTGADVANASLTFLFVQKLPGTPGDVRDFRQVVEDRVVPRLAAIPGVAGIELNGSEPEELSITIDLVRSGSASRRSPRSRRAPPTSPAARWRPVAASTCCASLGATRPRPWAAWSWTGATACRSAWPMSPRWR